MSKLGRHIVVEFYGCSNELLNDVSHIESSMVDAAKAADATVINSTFHHFSPFGVSGVVVIQESHLAIHTWPEYGYAAIDIFTCGDTVDPWVCYNFLFKALEAEHGSAIEMNRGQLSLLTKGAKPVEYPEGSSDHGKKIEPEYTRNIWFTERDENVALSLRHTGQFFYKEQSEYQRIEILDTFQYGKLLTLDGKVMTTEKDEYVYHEMITHLASLTHPNPKRALVVGGGDGGAVRELLRHESYEQVVMVEIDGKVIDACKEHLPDIAEVLISGHPKLDLRVQDGIEYVENAPDGSFDLIIIDSTDPIGPAKGLFTEEFYRHVYRMLSADGIMIVQSESPRFNTAVFQEIFACFKGIFGSNNVFPYLISVPTYPSGTWSLAFCSKGKVHPLNNFDAERSEAFSRKHGLKYYNADVHRAAFALPNYVKTLLGL